MRDVINFNIFTATPLKDTIPLYDDDNDLIGGAAPDPTGLSVSGIRCFVATKGHPVSLNLTADLPVYIQLIESDGIVKYGKITTIPPTTMGQYYFPLNKRYDE